ncbi:hypothetical protein SPI_07888 [Niveomyces insectorum RCEF 264]|uniref:Arrestin-like N-terminal domain-containing protein n=1 Tax=Niveomyces insectorum RCEF 264 TaxID=1081102 RepID=A0A167P4E6_9HYPO|nr:hypothetical protein SPI_07888 [Niveomyces insectorum RCEF 264]
MPATESRNGPNLSIRLTDSPPEYAPGDVILGHVVRGAQVVAARAIVSVRLYGRCKSKIHRQKGSNSSVTYRGRFNLLSQQQNDLFQKIFEGPVHVPARGPAAQWPFAIPIPTHPDPRSVPVGNDPSCSYLPLDASPVSTQPLPGSFSFADTGFHSRAQAFVEYWLEAEMRRVGGQHGIDTATLPVAVRALSTPGPIASFQPRADARLITVATLRMVPGMEGAELTFKQKAAMFFGSSKIPRYGFRLQVAMPAVIQLDHPTPLPLLFRVVPDRAHTSDILHDVPQVVCLTSLRVELEAYTEVLCPTSFNNPNRYNQSETINVGVEGAFFQLLRQQGLVVIPSGASAEFLNVGEHIRLRLGARHTSVFGRTAVRGSSPLQATFTTYNIKRWYALQWKATVDVAGETERVRGEHTVQLLAPSEEQAARFKPGASGTAVLQRAEFGAGESSATGAAGSEKTLPSYQEAMKDTERPSSFDGGG